MRRSRDCRPEDRTWNDDYGYPRVRSERLNRVGRPILVFTFLETFGSNTQTPFFVGDCCSQSISPFTPRPFSDKTPGLPSTGLSEGGALRRDPGKRGSRGPTDEVEGARRDSLRRDSRQPSTRLWSLGCR